MSFKAGQAIRSLGTLVLDPMDFPATMEFVDATIDTAVVRRLQRRMLDGLSEREIEHLCELTDRPLDLGALSRLPEGTLGHAFSRFMRGNHLQQDAQSVAYPPLEERLSRSWITRRFCRVHDIHHVLLDLDVSVPAELALQYFNLRNFGEPYAFFALLATPVVLARHGRVRRTWREIRRAWESAGRAANLFHVPFEDLLEVDLETVRARTLSKEAFDARGASEL